MSEKIKIDYEIVDRMAGHQPNKGVELVEAAKNIFKHVKEKAMQCAVNGDFIEFDTINDLQKKLANAAKNGFSIRVHDENIGG